MKTKTPILWIALPLVCAASLVAQTRPADEQISQRIASLEASQKEILKQLAELKTLIAQLRPAVPPNAAPGSPRPPSTPPPGVAVPTIPISIDGAASRGSASAKLTLVEFSDFQCPFCGRYSRDTYDQVVREYVETGKVRYVFRNFPIEALHPRAFRAAEAGECARRQGKFWELHDRLFGNQQALADADLAAQAKIVGLDTTAFSSCFANGSTTSRIKQDLADGRALYISGTPAFFIGVAADNKLKALRRITGAKPFAEFKANIDALLAAPSTP